jgi:hypothetical protein
VECKILVWFFCHLESFTVTWYILWPIGNLWSGNLLYTYFPVLVYFVKKNLATLITTERQNVSDFFCRLFWFDFCFENVDKAYQIMSKGLKTSKSKKISKSRALNVFFVHKCQVTHICELRASAKVAKIESFSAFLEHNFFKKNVSSSKQCCWPVYGENRTEKTK